MSVSAPKSPRRDGRVEPTLSPTLAGRLPRDGSPTNHRSSSAAFLLPPTPVLLLLRRRKRHGWSLFSAPRRAAREPDRYFRRSTTCRSRRTVRLHQDHPPQWLRQWVRQRSQPLLVPQLLQPTVPHVLQPTVPQVLHPLVPAGVAAEGCAASPVAIATPVAAPAAPPPAGRG